MSRKSFEIIISFCIIFVFWVFWTLVLDLGTPGKLGELWGIRYFIGF